MDVTSYSLKTSVFHKLLHSQATRIFHPHVICPQYFALFIIYEDANLEQAAYNAEGQIAQLLLLARDAGHLLQLLDVHAHAGRDVHLAGGDEHAPLPGPNLVDEVEEADERGGEIVLEEGVGSGLRADGVEGCVERSHDAEKGEADADVGADDAGLGTVRDFLERAAGCAPAGSEADVGEADGAPDEEVGDAGEGEEPVEEGEAIVTGLDYECEEAEEDLDDYAPDRATVLIDVGEEFGRHAVGCECLHRAGAAEGAGVGNGKHGDGDHCVEDRWEDRDTC